MQIAIFSDVHGNLPALEVVLNDIEERGIDQKFCLGDLVDFAPWGNKVIEKIKSLNIPCLMGNHDERI
ncbi:MAG: metallophosphoesterase family protein, partial [Chryseobacterium sp.]